MGKDSVQKCFGKKNRKNQPNGAGGTPSLPAMPHHLQNPKWPLGGRKMANRVWKGVYPLVFGALLLNKFFDQSTYSLKKEDDRGKIRRKK